jgi:5'(3')-deoxyribonucleotidase
MNIVVDLDGTLVNTPELMEKYSGKPFDEIEKGKWYSIVWREHSDEIEFYPNAVETVLKLVEDGHDVKIVTREQEREAVKKWYENTPLHDIVPIKFIPFDYKVQKYSSDTDVMIEDLWVEMGGFKGIRLLFKKDYNRKHWIKADYAFEDWSEVEDAIELFSEE